MPQSHRVSPVADPDVPDGLQHDVGTLVACTVVVFDDGTPAGQRTMAAARAQRRPHDLDVRHVVHPDPRGDGGARNKAIAKTRGSYVAVLHSGSVPGDDWLDASIAALRDDPTLGVVALTHDGATGLRIDVSVAAFVCRRTAWEAIGGFDAELSGAVHGLDIGWRTWLLGWRASAIDVDHSVVPGPEAASAAQLERLCGRLLRDPGALAAPRSRLPAIGSGGPTRRSLQRERRRSDGVLGPLLRAAIERGGTSTHLSTVIEAAGAAQVLGARRRVVVATADTLARKMAGPGIRAWRIASALASEHDVHLVTTGACDLAAEEFTVEAVDHDRFSELVQAADIVVFQGWVMADRPWLAQSDVVIVADIYDPMHLEQLEQGKEAPAEGGRWLAIAGANETLNQQLRRGDYFLSASAKQRDFWLGQAAAVGRLNQVLYDEDDSLTDRFRIVPFGIDDDPPRTDQGALRGRVDGIAEDDEIILWGGGIYNWFDPLTLIHAVDRLRVRRPKVRLYFLGTAHPNPEIPEMRMAVAARRLADELGIAGSHVFFNDGWVAFDERADYLLDADVAVSIHRQHIETEFSFRTRLLDYLWAERPIVATAGDSFAPLIVEHELGVVVEPGDVAGLEAALERLLADDELRAVCAANCAEFAERFRWSSVLETVREICAAPVRAPDVACPDTAMTFGVTGPPPAWREDLTLARRYLTEGGVPLLVDRVKSRVQRLRSNAD